MTAIQLWTLSDIETAWCRAAREADKRALWRSLAREGWFQACQDAVQKGNRTTLEAWLDSSDSIKNAIIQYDGPASSKTVRTYLRCSLTACGEGEVVPEGFPPGFCRDLIRTLLGEPCPPADKDVSLTVLLVDTARNQGVVATLTLELVPNGSGTLYPTPTLAFAQNESFRQAQETAHRYLRTVGLYQDMYDVRWQLQRHDGKPLANLSGPSMGAAFALGIGRLYIDAVGLQTTND